MLREVMLGMAIDATANASEDIFPARQPLRRRFEFAGGERSRCGANKGTPANREGNAGRQENDKKSQTNQQDSAQLFHDARPHVSRNGNIGVKVYVRI